MHVGDNENRAVVSGIGDQRAPAPTGNVISDAGSLRGIKAAALSSNSGAIIMMSHHYEAKLKRLTAHNGIPHNGISPHL